MRASSDESMARADTRTNEHLAGRVQEAEAGLNVELPRVGAIPVNVASSSCVGVELARVALEAEGRCHAALPLR